MEQATQSAPLLILKDLSVNNLQPVNLELHRGECITISGPSGSGKSLLLRALADLIPHQGEAYLDDTACSSFSPTQWRQQVGLLPAESAWWDERVGDHFANRCDDKLAILGFKPDVYDWLVSRCSTGERQRLAMLRLLCLKPEVLLLDEPTASLDQENVSAVEKLVAEYRQQGGAVIWVSHDPQQVKRVASRHFTIRGSQLLEEAL